MPIFKIKRKKHRRRKRIKMTANKYRRAVADPSEIKSYIKMIQTTKLFLLTKKKGKILHSIVKLKIHTK